MKLTETRESGFLRFWPPYPLSRQTRAVGTAKHNEAAIFLQAIESRVKDQKIADAYKPHHELARNEACPAA